MANPDYTPHARTVIAGLIEAVRRQRRHGDLLRETVTAAIEALRERDAEVDRVRRTNEHLRAQLRDVLTGQRTEPEPEDDSPC